MNKDGKMDPNLTLAHITHKTAVVLLHQGIAYPSAEWQTTSIQLSSASSAETCLAAASELAIISAEFLQGTTIVINSQYAFCLFICGRMLLAHEAHYGVSLFSTIDSLIANLHEISRRWSGAYSSTDTDNLASKFAERLSDAHSQQNMSLDIRKAVISATHEHDFMPVEAEQHSNVTGSQNPGNATFETPPEPMLQLMNCAERANDAPCVRFDTGGSPDCASLAFPPLHLSFQPQPSPGPTLVEASAGTMDTAYSQSNAEFENLNDFFQYSF